LAYRSGSAATKAAIAGAVLPEADARIIIARRTRIVPCLPRRTIRTSVRPSSPAEVRCRLPGEAHSRIS
jgi:hypothetical protein